MIVTNLENLASQVAPTPAMTQSIAFLKTVVPDQLVDSRIDIDGDQAYAIVQSYHTVVPTAAPLYEAHRQYLDIQYVLSGEEVIGWAPLDQVDITKPYDSAIDALLGHVTDAVATRVKLTPGYLAVLYPTDAHCPRLALNESIPVKKIVVKVAVDH